MFVCTTACMTVASTDRRAQGLNLSLSGAGDRAPVASGGGCCSLSHASSVKLYHRRD